MLHGLATVLNGVPAAILLTIALVLTVSFVIVVGGRYRPRELLRRQYRPRTADPFEPGRTPLADGFVDIASELNAVLRRYNGFAAERSVGLELAVQPDLTLRADPRALREILGGLVAPAIKSSLCGRVLLGAVRQGDRVKITVSDDGADTDCAVRSSRLPPVERLAALQGATVEVDTSAGQGTTVVLRMPVGAEDHPPGDEHRLDPTSVRDAAPRVPARSTAQH